MGVSQGVTFEDAEVANLEEEFSRDGVEGAETEVVGCGAVKPDEAGACDRWASRG